MRVGSRTRSIGVSSVSSGVGSTRCRSLIFPSPLAHLQSFKPDFSQNYLQLSGTVTDGSFGAPHPDTDRSYAEARERQSPQLIIVGLRPWSRIEMGGFC